MTRRIILPAALLVLAASCGPATTEPQAAHSVRAQFDEDTPPPPPPGDTTGRGGGGTIGSGT
jgi:hypothetical protein